jgi:hypothetical protein
LGNAIPVARLGQLSAQKSTEKSKAREFDRYGEQRVRAAVEARDDRPFVRQSLDHVV